MQPNPNSLEVSPIKLRMIPVKAGVSPPTLSGIFLCDSGVRDLEASQVQLPKSLKNKNSGRVASPFSKDFGFF